MLSASRSATILIALVLPAASGAVAQERCSGTLCDFYYGNSAPAAAHPTSQQPAGQPPGATPLTVPSGGILGFFSRGNGTAQPGTTAAPAARPLVGVGGDGLAAMARGEPAERCTGTFCDWYYGGPPPERPAGQPAAATTDPQATPGTDAAPEATADDTPAPARRRRTVQKEIPRCAASAEDPWKCYR